MFCSTLLTLSLFELRFSDDYEQEPDSLELLVALFLDLQGFLSPVFGELALKCKKQKLIQSILETYFSYLNTFKKNCCLFRPLPNFGTILKENRLD